MTDAALAAQIEDAVWRALEAGWTVGRVLSEVRAAIDDADIEPKP